MMVIRQVVKLRSCEVAKLRGCKVAEWQSNKAIAVLQYGGRLVDRLQRPVCIYPLVVLRIGFGLLMLVSTVRFVANGWVDAYYIAPQFHFTYWRLDWVRPLPGNWLYVIYVALALLSIFIALGLYYRVSITAFFLLFTYTELLDKSYYLNHYYFISVLSFLLIFLPLNQYCSVDAILRPRIYTTTVPMWTIGAVRLQLALVFFFAGLAKLTPDWLFRAMPLKIWLAARTDFPLIGFLFDADWFAYLMSWSGALYDLSIPFLLLWHKTRPYAFGLVVLFHLMTWMLFQIGMFPWIMIVCTLAFFDGKNGLVSWLAGWLSGESAHTEDISARPNPQSPIHSSKIVSAILLAFFLIQFMLPLRHWLYPGDVHWTEEGYRFAWKVMLVEKTAHAIFHVREPSSQREWSVYPSDYLTPQQEKQMSFQPDMILQFAHYLQKLYQGQGMDDVEVRTEAYVSLNGRSSRLLIDPTIDLTQERNHLLHKRWILHYEQ